MFAALGLILLLASPSPAGECGTPVAAAADLSTALAGEAETSGAGTAASWAQVMQAQADVAWGERGTSVEKLQELLNDLGFPVEETGILDEETERALESFQSTYRSVATGILDANTAAMLEEAKKASVSLGQLRGVMTRLSEVKAKKYLPYLNQAMYEFDIDNDRRKAFFLAQLAQESSELRYFRELASGAAYEGRRDLGNVFRGDGRRYKGRGPIQLTGRANYKAAGEYLELDLVKDPNQVATAEVGFRTSGWFWMDKGLNAKADLDTEKAFKQVTKKVNGCVSCRRTHYADRKAYWDRAEQVLAAPEDPPLPERNPLRQRGEPEVTLPERNPRRRQEG